MSLGLTGRLVALPRLRDGLAFFRGYFLVVAGAAITRALSFFTGVLLARELGASSFGQVSVFLAFLVIWVGNDFLDATFVRYANAREGDEPGDYLRAVLALKIGLNAALLFISFPVAGLLANVAFGKPSLHTPIFAALVCGVGLNFLSLRAATYQANERFAQYTAVNSSFYVLTFIAVILIVLASSEQTSTTGVYASYVGVSILVGIYAFVSLKRAVRQIRFDKRLVKRVIAFSRWLFAANAAYIVFQQLDLLLVTAFASLREVGEYSVGIRLVGVLSLLTGTLAPALLPRATRAIETPALLRAYLRKSVVLSGVILAFALAVWLAAPAIATILFGNEYEDAALFTRILLVGTALVAIYTPLSQLLLAYTEPRRMFYLSALKLAVIGGIGLVLASRFGGVGAALAVTFSEAAALVYILVVLRHRIATAFGQRPPATAS